MLTMPFFYLKKMKSLKLLFSSFQLIASKEQKRRAKKGLLLTIIQALADVIGLAAIVPVLMLAIDGDFLEKSSKLRFIYAKSPFHSEARFLIGLIGFVILFFLAKNIYAYWVQAYIKKNAAHIVARATALKYRHFINKEYSEIMNNGTPDFINIVMNIPYHYVTGMFLPFVNLVAEVAVVLFFGIFVFYNPFVFLILMATLGPAIYLINRSIKTKIVHIGKISGKLREETLEELNLGLNGLTEIKLNRVGDYFIDSFVKKQYAYAKNELKSLQLQSLPSRMLEMIALVGVVFLVVYGYFFSNNPSEVRVLGALFVVSIFRLIPAINRIMVSLMHIKIFSYTAEELTKSARFVKQHTKPLVLLNTLEVKNLCYSYPNADFPLLENINFSLSPGEIVGLTGASGSGKSTLVKILLRLIKENTGEITVDGNPINEQNEISWQEQIGFVGQQPYILKGTVQENVALAEIENIDKEKLINALNLAGLADFASAKKLSYNVGENGIRLSEGQKQRLALARVIYKGHNIIVLDETTSALDEQTELRVIKTLENLADNKFCILIIAHRNSVLKACNKVYELANRKLKLRIDG